MRTPLTGPEARVILESWRKAGAIRIRPGIGNCQECGDSLKKVQQIHAFHAEGDTVGLVGGSLWGRAGCQKQYYVDETSAY